MSPDLRQPANAVRLRTGMRFNTPLITSHRRRCPLASVGICLRIAPGMVTCHFELITPDFMPMIVPQRGYLAQSPSCCSTILVPHFRRHSIGRLLDSNVLHHRTNPGELFDAAKGILKTAKRRVSDHQSQGDPTKNRREIARPSLGRPVPRPGLARRLRRGVAALRACAPPGPGPGSPPSSRLRIHAGESLAARMAGRSILPGVALLTVRSRSTESPWVA